LLHQKNSRWIRNLNARNENITLLEENLELKKKILQGILHTENESKQNHERTGSIKP
jgi:hypothetical protein